jgi:hypothetical protein
LNASFALHVARAGLAAALLSCSATAAPAATLEAASIEELEASLARARPGTRIDLAPLKYQLDRPLVVPNGVTLSGGGRMSVDERGRATGFVPGPVATFLIAGEWRGDAVALGDGSELRGVRLVDQDREQGRRNLVAVVSRRAGDRIRARVRECEIETAAVPEFRDPAQPRGRAVMVVTRGHHGTAGAHEGARVGVSVLRSIVRSPTSQALFAVNFASRGVVDVEVRDSVFGGVTSAVGGVPRPEAVAGARTTFRSRNSLYRRVEGFDGFGWQLIGGSGVPHEGMGSAGGASRNELIVDSRGDAIEGFRTGVYAAGGRRVGGLSGPSIGNVARLRLRDLAIEGAGEAPVDFELSGALAEPAPGGAEALPPGDSNLLQVDLRGFRRGAGSSRYEAVRGPGGRDDNRLEFAGDPGGFARSNPAFQPVPGEEFFSR